MSIIIMQDGAQSVDKHFFDPLCVRHWYLKDEYKSIQADIPIF